MANVTELAEARAAGLGRDERELFEAFKALGMTAPAALAATRGRATPWWLSSDSGPDTPEEEPSPEVQRAFGRLGERPR